MLGARTRRRLAARLEVAPEEHEHRDDRRDLEVDVVVGVGEQDRQRPQVGGGDTERDQRVHRRRAVAKVDPGRLMDGPRPPSDDRGREHERDPLPPSSIERGDHAEDQDGQGEQGGDRDSSAKRRESAVVEVLVMVAVRGRQRRAVAERFDSGDELSGCDGVGVEVHRSRLRREVDRRGHPLIPLSFFSTRRARGARHAGDRKLDLLRCHDRTSRSMARLASLTRRSASAASSDRVASATQCRRWASSSSTAMLCRARSWPRPA